MENILWINENLLLHLTIIAIQTDIKAVLFATLGLMNCNSFTKDGTWLFKSVNTFSHEKFEIHSLSPLRMLFPLSEQMQLISPSIFLPTALKVSSVYVSTTDDAKDKKLPFVSLLTGSFLDGVIVKFHDPLG